MRIINNVVFLTMIAAVFPATAIEQTTEPAPSLTFSIVPKSVAIGSFYGGVPIEATGTAGAGSEVVVVVRGKHTEETFNKKVQVGPLWLSSGKVRVSKAPSLFVVLSARPVAQFLSRDTIEEYELDVIAVRHRMRIEVEGRPLPRQIAAENYQRLKTDEGIYRVISGAVVYRNADEDRKSFSVRFDWPPTAPPGDYDVTAYECCHRQVLAEYQIPLAVRLAGGAAQVHHLAMNHGTAYGAFAVIIALAAGFLIDFLTQKLFRTRVRTAH